MVHCEAEIAKLTKTIEEEERFLGSNWTDQIVTLRILLLSRHRRAGCYEKKGDKANALKDYQWVVDYRGEQDLGTTVDGVYLSSLGRVGYLYWTNGFRRGAFDTLRIVLARDQKLIEFFALWDDHPTELIPNLLYALSGKDPKVWSNNLLTAIKVDPAGAREFLDGVEDLYHSIYYDLLRTIVLYELGEDGKDRVMAIYASYFGDGFWEGKPLGELPKNLQETLWHLSFCRHPIGTLTWGFYFILSQETLRAIHIFEELAVSHPEHTNWSRESIAIALTQIRSAIDRHIQRREYHMAAVLAKYQGDFACAGDCYLKLGEGIEDNRYWARDATGLPKGIRYGVTYVEPSPVAAADFYESAAECFHKAGDIEQESSCIHNAQRLRTTVN